MPATSVQRSSRCAPAIVWDPSQFSLVRDTRSGYETPPSAVDPPLSFPPLCTTERKRSHVPPPPLLRKLSHTRKCRDRGGSEKFQVLRIPFPEFRTGEFVVFPSAGDLGHPYYTGEFCGADFCSVVVALRLSYPAATPQLREYRGRKSILYRL